MTLASLMPVALLFGLVHSAHCAGMCGPFAVAAAGSRGATGVAAYLVGKAFTYVFLGALVGAAGAGLLGRTAGLQDALALTVGAALVITGVLRLLPPRARASGAALSRGVARLVAGVRPGPGLGGRFTLGALTGLLPCGVLYLALLQAAATARPGAAVLFMAVFALGTAPALAAVAGGGRWLSRSFSPDRLRWAAGSLVVVAGLLTLWRVGLPGLQRACDACFR